MKHRTLLSSVCVLVLLLCGLVESHAQDQTRMRAILSNFKNYRYGNVFIFETDVINALNGVLSPPEPDMNKFGNAKESRLKEDIEAKIDDGEDPETDDELKKKLKSADRQYIKYYQTKRAWADALFRKAFIVTTRFGVGEPFDIIALLTSKKDGPRLEDNIDGPQKIYLNSELLRLPSPDSVGLASNLYEFLERKIVQNDAVNVTAEAQGLGEDTFLPKQIGIAKLVDDKNIQQYLRISEGQPQDYQYPNEVVVGFADRISYRRYEPLAGEAITAAGAEEGDSTVARVAYNRYLPKYGMELKYGFEEINYPSLWSERLTASLLWQSYKIGVILPTSGWARLTTDLFETARTLSGAGLGGSFGMDIPMAIVQQSGVFNFNASYLFGDASRDQLVPNQFLYVPRMHLQGHYSFAISIDETNYFRFKVGGTMYQMERWQNAVVVDPRRPRDTNFVITQSIFPRTGDTTTVIGGISGKIEYMAQAKTVHWGAGLQFFDGTLLGDFWAQVPITNEFALRGQARYFRTVTRDPREWELQNVFLPSVQLVVNF